MADLNAETCGHDMEVPGITLSGEDFVPFLYRFPAKLPVCLLLVLPFQAAKCKERRQQDNLFTHILRIFLEMEEGPLDERYAKKVGLYCGTTLVGRIFSTGFLGSFEICQQVNCHESVTDTAELYRDDGVDLVGCGGAGGGAWKCGDDYIGDEKEGFLD
ncbi:hypothetical protein DKX38_008620 [Salix brachista]|uniref:Uncharacterized protein n=1 Tax=Salix brachista TaxID=2182728 RepID=A0A5N5MTG9_9ROSI|nr:hypothetical protein DKX38_008620 [Salix brachista]